MLNWCKRIIYWTIHCSPYILLLSLLPCISSKWTHPVGFLDEVNEDQKSKQKHHEGWARIHASEQLRGGKALGVLESSFRSKRGRGPQGLWVIWNPSLSWVLFEEVVWPRQATAEQAFQGNGPWTPRTPGSAEMLMPHPQAWRQRVSRYRGDIMMSGWTWESGDERSFTQILGPPWKKERDQQKTEMEFLPIRQSGSHGIRKWKANILAQLSC